MNSVKILLAEDDKFLREIYEEALKEAGLELEVAVDGEDAYNKILRGDWDLVLLDVVMPKMTGIEVMKKINSAKKTSLFRKIVFLTNISDTDDLDQLTQLGNGYLIKSELTPLELVEKIKSYLKK